MTPETVTFRLEGEFLVCDGCKARSVIPRLGMRHNKGCPHALLGFLTSRERQVAIGISEGKSCKMIAEHLGISRRTVECHRWSLYRRMGVNGVASLVKELFALGVLVNPPEKVKCQ